MNISEYSQYDRIIKDCFWDSNLKAEDIDTMLRSGDKRKQKYLFEKVLINSTNMLADLGLFNRDKLLSLMKEYRIPEFNREYIFRRKNAAEVCLFDAPLLIDELKWIV